MRDIVTRHILPLKSLPYYLHHRAFLPSFALCLLYLTVLSLSGQMVTYLLSTGYTSLHVGLIRFASTVFELSATWVAPRLMQRIGAVRSGIWSLSWQMTWLAAGASWFFSGIHGHGTNSVTAAAGLVVGVTLSRVGLWSYDLCAQSIIQEVRDILFFSWHSRDKSSCPASNSSGRKSKATTAAPFPLSKRPSKTSSSLPRTQRPSCSRDRTSSSGLLPSVLPLYTWLAGSTRVLSTRDGATCSTGRSVHAWRKEELVVETLATHEA